MHYPSFRYGLWVGSSQNFNPHLIYPSPPKEMKQGGEVRKVDDVLAEDEGLVSDTPVPLNRPWVTKPTVQIYSLSNTCEALEEPSVLYQTYK